MVDTGKRPNPQSDSGSDQKRRIVNREGSSDGELVVYRILCPDSIIGSVIGKSGKVINSIRQESKAKVKVVDPFPGTNERVITVYCHVREKKETHIDDDVGKILCPAQDGLMRLHSAIVNALEVTRDTEKQKVTAHLLVPASQSANVIGKSGATIKRLRSKTGANIKVTQKDPTDLSHSCALAFDNFVQITGDHEAVRAALYAVSSILYKFSPKEEIPLDTNVPDITEIAPIIIPSDVPIYSNGAFYPNTDPLGLPPRSLAPIVGAGPPLSDLHGYVADGGSQWPLYPSIPLVSGYGGPVHSEELIVRLLCPSDKIGRVIGKGGGSIKNLRKVTGARIDVDDLKGNCDECVITISTTESVEDVKSVSVEAVLLLQGKINDISDDEDENVIMRMLVPKKVVGCLIGKGGSIINEMRKNSKADIRISKGEKPKCAASEEELVEVSGAVGYVRDALGQIVLRLRNDVLKDNESDHTGSDPIYSVNAPKLPNFPTVPSAAPLDYNTRSETGGGLGMLTSSLHGYGPYQGGDSGFGSLSSFTPKSYGGLSTSSEMIIPGSAIGKVMGKGGANITNIRKISGAVIEIVDSKTSRSDRIAQISGTPEQKRTAENLLQAFIMAT